MNYDSIKNEIFNGRYIYYDKLEEFILSLDHPFTIQPEGKSVEGRTIYSVSFGTGSKKILMWSQMHGNESTTTKALLDLINFFKSDCASVLQMNEKLHLKLILVVNPDGSVVYTRENAQKIDLNRDAKAQTQPESRVLKKIFHNFKPDFAFNLHDQRTIFSAGHSCKPASVSFLAPAFDESKAINASREKAMLLLAGISQFLQVKIPDQIGRYDDGFNLNCVGDSFQRAGVPTVLFEAGHYQKDYEREETRKYIFLALKEALELIVTEKLTDFRVEDYQKIPQNEKLFYDIIFRNVKVNGECDDVAIQFEERLIEGKIVFIPKIKKIGDLKTFCGHREINGNNAEIRINSGKNFELNTEINQISLDDKLFSMNLTNY